MKRYVTGPDGSPLSLSDLPPINTKRWVIRRKAVVVAAVRGGLLTLEEACTRYALTADEFMSWQQSLQRHGLLGLRVTKLQRYNEWKPRATIKSVRLAYGLNGKAGAK